MKLLSLSAFFLASITAVDSQNLETDYVELKCTYPPFPAGIPEETCFQRSFASAQRCEEIDASLTNETLLYRGWQCCGWQAPFAPPPALPFSFWVKFDAAGVETNRCLASGECQSPCPEGRDYAIGRCDARIPPFPSA